MKKNTHKISVFLLVLIAVGAFVVVGGSFINKKTETSGSKSQPGIEDLNKPYEISGTVNKVSL